MRTLGFFIAGVSSAWAFVMLKKALRRRPEFFDPSAHPEKHDERWDAQDEAVWESFPASDPPATW